MNATATPLSEEELKNVVQGPGDVEWRYEMRRECQEILPGLLLGPFVASKSLETLQSLQITHIVCIRDAKEAFSVRPRFPDNFSYLTLDVEDNEEQNLIRLFPMMKQFVVMFVMQYYQLSWEDALHMVQNRRYCISPNGGFLTQLKEYEAIYRASVAVASFPSTNRTISRRKREDEDDDEATDRYDDRKRALVDSTSDAAAPSYDPDSMDMS